MVRVVGVEEVEFWVVDLILSNSGLKLRSIPLNKKRWLIISLTKYNKEVLHYIIMSNLATKLAVLSTIFRTSGGG